MASFYGKYRGTVVDNNDPMQMGRLSVQVPDVSNVQSSTWAMPSAPLAGGGSGSVAVPPVGASVWVEFEQGDSDYPVWSGCFWGSSAEVPPLALAAPTGVQAIVIQSVGGQVLMLSDQSGSAGGILLKSSSGASIAINDQGITIDNGQGATITLSSNSVNVNQGAFNRHLSSNVKVWNMGSYLLQQGATVLCSHGGQAMPTATNSRVTISGQPTAVISAPWTVAGCPLVPPPLPPCVTAQWVTGTTRVTSTGQPLVVQSGQAVCVPTGTPLVPTSMQTRVTAT